MSQTGKNSEIDAIKLGRCLRGIVVGLNTNPELKSPAAFSANSLLWQRGLLEQICL